MKKRQQCAWLRSKEMQLKIIVCVVACLILGAVAICNVEMKWSKAQMVIDVVCIVVAIILLSV